MKRNKNNLDVDIYNTKEDEITDIKENEKNIDQKQIEIQKEQLYQDRYEQKTNERRLFSKWVKWVSSIWLALVLLILFFQGFGSEFKFFNLSDSVLITLLSTTTINVLGLSVIVLKGFFDKE